MLGRNGMDNRTLAHPTPHPMGALQSGKGCERTPQTAPLRSRGPEGAASPGWVRPSGPKITTIIIDPLGEMPGTN